MQVRWLIYLLLISMIQLACDKASFIGGGGGEARDGEKDSSSDDSDQENEEAAEPVSVGGAYLGCFKVSSNSKEDGIGCAVRDVNTHQKRSYANAKFDWLVYDSKGKTVLPRTETGRDSDDYHQLFYFKKATFKGFKIELSIKSMNGQVIADFDRSLGVLDPPPAFEIVGEARVHNKTMLDNYQMLDWEYFFVRGTGGSGFFEFIVNADNVQNEIGPYTKLDDKPLRMVKGQKPCILNIPGEIQPKLAGSQDVYSVPIQFEDHVGVVFVYEAQKSGARVYEKDMEKLISEKYFACTGANAIPKF